MLTALLLLLAPQTDAPARVERRVFAMGTSLELTVAAPTRAAALAASERAVLAIAGVEARLSTWRPESELSRLNRAPLGERFALSPELAADLELALACARESDGAFDPGVGALVDAWDLRGAGRVPSPQELRDARAKSGAIAALELAGGFAVRRHAGLRIEDGGWGKGVGLAAALAALREGGVTDAVLDFGGQIATLGGAPTTWGLADPRDRSRTVLRVRLDAGSLATSGNSEHARVVDGRRIGHVLDPRTGEPAPDFGSATVWSPDPARADAFSTAAFVLGPERALAWASGRAEVELLVIEVLEGGALRVRATEGLRGRVETVADDLRLEFPPFVRPLAR